MEQYLWIIWLAIFVIALVIEASGPSLVSIWFALGALVTMIISFIPGVAWWIELIVFVVVSITAILALRPILSKYFKINKFNSNVDSLSGKEGYVLEEISFLTPGVVKIGDVKWSAIPVKKDEIIPVNSVVEVVNVEGNKLIVKKVEEKK